MKVLVAQKGAREHFLAARSLHQQGSLAGLIVDWYRPRTRLGQGLARRLGRNGASAMAAHADGIPDAMVRPLWLNGLRAKWQERKAAASNTLFDCYPKTDAAFANAVAKLSKPDHDAFFGYSYASLEALEAEKQNGRLTLVCQIDPGPVEHRMVSEEMSRFPRLAGLPQPFPEAHFNRARREWAIADVIIVNSEWSRKALIAEGAAPDKIHILPLAYEAESAAQPMSAERKPGAPLRILWLGQVNVRKGIHYLIEAARILKNEPIEITVAGPIQINQAVVDDAPKNMRWLGAIPRSQTKDLYRSHDVFVLPTLSDGFAITQIEAMAYGLPVVATPNCGLVVNEGVTGRIVPARNSEALANALSDLSRNPSLVAQMSGRCLEAVKDYSVEAYGRALHNIIQTHLKPNHP